MPDPTSQAAFRGDIWLKSCLGSLLLMTPALVLGVTRDMDDPAREEDESHGWMKDILFQVAIPGFLVWLLTLGVTSRVPTAMGFGMLREKGVDTSVKDSIRTNMTNSGVVLALLLTVILAMWQVDRVDSGGFNRIDMWYRAFLIFGTEACTRGVIMVSGFLVYMEPLDEASSQHFAVDNMIYLGEPTTCLFQTLLYFLQATLLWVFNTEDKYVGCLAYLIMTYCIARTTVVVQYLAVWHSPVLADHVRQARKEKLKMAKAVDGTGAKRASRTSA